MMADDGEAGVFLTLSDCMTLYPKLKMNEPSLSNDERKILFKLEKILYGNLSVREMEELLEKGSAALAHGKFGRI